MSRRTGRIGLATVVVAGLLAGAAPVLARLADVYLRDGMKLRGDVTEMDDEIVLLNAAGELRLPRGSITKIEYAPESEVVAPPVTPAPAIEPAPIIDGTEDAAGAEPGDLAPAPPISKDDIQRLRIRELILEGAAENVRVQFEKPARARDLPLEVLDELKGRADFDPLWEETLLRGKPQDKLQLILRETGLKYADRIKIMSDPEVFQTFRRRVLPMVNNGCARAGCHWGSESHVFRFPVGSKTGDTYAYTVFALLDGMRTPGGELINRDYPEDSLLLTYMLPQEENERAHPAVGKGPSFKAVVRGTDDPQYAVIADWINFLVRPHPDYGLEYENPYARPRGEAFEPVMPATEPTTPEPQPQPEQP